MILMPGTKEWRDDAESDLIDVVRRNDAQNFQVTIRCRDGVWHVETVDLDAAEAANTSIGEGNSFADAWHGQKPIWA
ncbi:MAG: hypothetical protein ABS57_06645 [Mesorhizobium sp. SCN 65-12]|nr:MAG: hypothetical protein ABS57_06645 [Mesorhizobium sp. SCN 65-12]